jgi:hypothetical protein
MQGRRTPPKGRYSSWFIPYNLFQVQQYQTKKLLEYLCYGTESNDTNETDNDDEPPAYDSDYGPSSYG